MIATCRGISDCQHAKDTVVGGRENVISISTQLNVTTDTVAKISTSLSVLCIACTLSFERTGILPFATFKIGRLFQPDAAI